MVINEAGYRYNVGIILVNDANNVFWGRRIGHDTWQFPQGGMHQGETPEETMYRELNEEIGLDSSDVTILGVSQDWLSYRLPKQFLRRNTNPVVIGQKQKWFLLRLACHQQKIRLDLSESPEFDSWRWVDYWYPSSAVIFFKRKTYQQALQEFAPLLFGDDPASK